MAKLPAPKTAGFNAGGKNQFKSVRVDNIVIDPEISGIFKISDRVRDEIKQKIKNFGYDKSQPVVIWKDKNILLDGHTRLEAAREAGLDEIPAVEKEFEDRDNAILYTFERQVVRRNLTGAEIMTAAGMLKGGKNPNGAGRAAEVLAGKLGISASTMYKAQAVLKEADKEAIQDVMEGRKSIKKAYNEAKRKNNPKPDVAFNAGQGLPQGVSFLKAAVILLVEAKQKEAAEMLVSHFLKKNEKRGFYDLLPEAVRAQLPRLPLVARNNYSPQQAR